MPRKHCTACCPSCGLHFLGETAFDAHLGSAKNDFQHRYPLELPKKLESRGRGECRLGGRTETVELWGLAGGRERMTALHG